MKTCTICKSEKSRSDFGRNSRKTDGLQPYCKPCSKAKDKKHYASSSTRKRRIVASSQAMLEKNRDLVWNILLRSSCVDCGEGDPLVLQFDHLRDKRYDLNVAMRRTSSQTLVAELAKCDIVCANCHQKRTAMRANTWRVRRVSITGNARAS